MYYSVHKQPHLKHLTIRLGYITLALISLMIGAILGLKWAIVNLPLPTNQTIYITGGR